METELLQIIASIDLTALIIKALRVFLIIGAAWLLLWLFTRLIRQVFSVGRADLDKKETLVSLLSSLIRYVVWAVALMLVIQTFDPGFNITPILAGAGVVGLAVGFGAQNLIRDVITGFFIMFEDQLRVGDYVLVNGDVFGRVEEVGLRMTALREWSGRKFYIANAEIKTISNYNRRELRALVTVTFPFEEDPVEVRRLLDDVCTEFTADHPDYLRVDESGAFIEPPQILGVTDIDQNARGGQYTIIALTEPPYLWTTERTLREMIWTRARERGIRLAYPHRVIERQPR
ncbi:MAG: mechanosensitive ion channel family protein [Candidatus Desulforudis sp.]|nr:mechanosensitive ion channel family protein [Desulforudis sp.]